MHYPYGEQELFEVDLAEECPNAYAAEYCLSGVDVPDLPPPEGPERVARRL
jgi:hypothetical protein